LTPPIKKNKRRLNQYSGPLTAQKVTEGINAAIKNAKRLAAEARLLFDNGRYATSMALAILSIEEVGKVGILRGLAVAPDGKSLRLGWQDYRSHTKKNAGWLFFFQLQSGARRASDFEQLFSDDAEHPQLLENVKQIFLYTDCVGNCNWSEPEETAESDLAQWILRTAESLADVRNVTTEEMELWIEYLKPHWNQNEARSAALFAWDKEMRRRGLVDGTITMEEFFREGFPA
jgi:AbiV family abortive infection protein